MFEDGIVSKSWEILKETTNLLPTSHPIGRDAIEEKLLLLTNDADL